MKISKKIMAIAVTFICIHVFLQVGVYYIHYYILRTNSDVIKVACVLLPFAIWSPFYLFGVQVVAPFGDRINVLLNSFLWVYAFVFVLPKIFQLRKQLKERYDSSCEKLLRKQKTIFISIAAVWFLVWVICSIYEIKRWVH